MSPPTCYPVKIATLGMIEVIADTIQALHMELSPHDCHNDIEMSVAHAMGFYQAKAEQSHQGCQPAIEFAIDDLCILIEHYKKEVK